MNTVRENIMKGPARLLLPMLAVIFVISISLHNHAIGIDSGSVIELSDAAPDTHHSVQDCSACLLQGNVKLPDMGAVFIAPIPLIITSLEETEFLIPSSFLQLNKPSRSPPTV